jgi:hypothetical protein
MIAWIKDKSLYCSHSGKIGWALQFKQRCGKLLRLTINHGRLYTEKLGHALSLNECSCSTCVVHNGEIFSESRGPGWPDLACVSTQPCISMWTTASARQHTSLLLSQIYTLNCTLCRQGHHASEVWIAHVLDTQSAMYPGVKSVVWQEWHRPGSVPTGTSQHKYWYLVLLFYGLCVPTVDLISWTCLNSTHRVKNEAISSTEILLMLYKE